MSVTLCALLERYIYNNTCLNSGQLKLPGDKLNSEFISPVAQYSIHLASRVHSCSRRFDGFLFILFFPCDYCWSIAVSQWSSYAQYITRFVRTLFVKRASVNPVVINDAFDKWTAFWVCKQIITDDWKLVYTFVDCMMIYNTCCFEGKLKYLWFRGII